MVIALIILAVEFIILAVNVWHITDRTDSYCRFAPETKVKIPVPPLKNHQKN
jgi:hypothetical protein